MEINELVGDFPKRIADALKIGVPEVKKDFNRVVVIGMGGCYISGLVLKNVLDVPVEVCPGNVPVIDDKTLVILISYSGNTKEVINAFGRVKSHRRLLIATSGGMLLKLSGRKSVIKLPENLHQRFTVPYTVFPVLKALGITNLEGIGNVLERNKEKIETVARGVAKSIGNKIPLIYSTNHLYPAAYRLQTTLSEDGKVIAHSNRITELFHNELEALPDRRFFPILILDKKELAGFEKQADYFKKKLKSFYEFGFERYSRDERMFLVFYFGDFLGYYLSKLKKTRMGVTRLSDEIKKL